MTAGPPQHLRLALRDLYWGLRYFASTERALPARLRSLRMLVRGFNSDRRWLLPPGASRRNGYIADLPYARRAHRMNPDCLQKLMNDKIAFAQSLRGGGDPAPSAPRTLGVLRSGVWTAHEQSPPGRCIVKPAHGSGGSGVRAFDSLEQARAAAVATGEDHLVQELVHQHAAMAALWPDSLNTVRVLAIRTADGRVVLPRAVQRIGRRTTGAVDNYSSGGLAAWVDLHNGTLGPVVQKVQRRERRLFLTIRTPAYA